MTQAETLDRLLIAKLERLLLEVLEQIEEQGYVNQDLGQRITKALGR